MSFDLTPDARQALRLIWLYHGSAGARFVIGIMTAAQAIGYFVLNHESLTTSYRTQAQVMPLSFYAWILLAVGLSLAATAPWRFSVFPRLIASVATSLSVLFAHVWWSAGAWSAVSMYIYLAIFFSIQATYIIPE